MIKKISVSLIFACLLIAIPLALMGYERVEIGGPFLAFLRTTSGDLEKFKVEIPNIPMIPSFSEPPSGILVVVDFLRKVVNGLSTFLNVIILLLNYIIELLEFLFFCIRNLISLKDTIARSSVLPSA